jgi:cell division protease FtsH
MTRQMQNAPEMEGQGMKKIKSILQGSLPAKRRWQFHGVPMNAIGMPRAADTVTRRRNALSADIVAASVALRAALPAGLVETFGKGKCTTLVIQVPTAGWCGPVRRAFVRLLAEAQPGGSSGEICSLARDGTERGLRPNSGEDEILLAINEGRGVLGISPDPRRLLPRALAAPDISVILRPLTGVQMREVIGAVTGRKGRRPLADDVVAGLDPTDIAIAVRPGSTPAECEARMRKLTSARVVQIGNDVPLLQDLSGCDEARDWGLALAKDIALYKDGRIAWSEVAEVGAILVGPPGCGKTQFAKSLSRTLGLPLISTSYAAWQSHREGHLGDLLVEMKRSAMEARSLAPSIWFIDEIDSMPNRSDADLKYREWYVAIVNAMLEISERAARPGVILLGAANDVSRMDSALMRPARFGDRVIEIPLPDEAALAGIMRHHLGEDLAAADLTPMAQAALGASGARVAEWVRGAKRSARNDGRPIRPADLMRQIAPTDDRSVADIRRAAVHEAGHCVALALTGQVVDFVSIRRSGSVGGQTTAPHMGTDFPTRADFERTVSVLLAGRAAEEVLIGTPSASASGGPHSDLARATDLVVGMHASFGLGKFPVAHVQFRQASELIRADANLRRAVDSDMAEIYRHSLEVIKDNATAVERVAERLIAVQHLGWADIQRLLKPTSAPRVQSKSIVPDLRAGDGHELPPLKRKAP